MEVGDNLDDSNKNQDKDDNGGFTSTNRSLYQYVTFSLGQHISFLGSSIVQFAITLWVAFKLADDPELKGFQGTFLGLSFALIIAPAVIVGLFVSPQLDKWGKKKVLLGTDFAQALLALVLFFIFLLDLIGNLLLLLVILLFVIGARSAIEGLRFPAAVAILPLLVPQKHLTSVNSLNEALAAIGQLLSPLVAALLISWWSLDNIHLIILIDVVTFLVAVIPTLILNIPSTQITKNKTDTADSNKESEVNENGYFQRLKEGFTFVIERRPLFILITNFTLLFITLIPAYVLTIVLITDEDFFNLGEQEGAWTLGILGTLSEVGALLSALTLIGTSIILTRRKSKKNTIFGKNTRGIFFGLFFVYIAALLIGLSGTFKLTWLLIIAFIILGFAFPLASTHNENIWQTNVPPELYARVFTVRTLSWAFGPIAVVILGILADLVRPDLLLIIPACVSILFLLISYQFLGFKNIEEDLNNPEEITQSQQ